MIGIIKIFAVFYAIEVVARMVDVVLIYKSKKYRELKTRYYQKKIEQLENIGINEWINS